MSGPPASGGPPPAVSRGPGVDQDAARAFLGEVWDTSIVPSLVEYIRIPCQSPAFDAGWEAAGHMDRAVELVAAWCRARPIQGLEVEVVRLPGRTPLIVMEVPGAGGPTALLYGHLDKQPPMEGWSEGLGPWQPVLRDGRLYGRGGADDGYAAYASLAALEALQRQGVPHGRCVILIEGSEESGSPDLPAYLEQLGERIGQPDLVVCLDSGCGNYEQLWTTTSLRGLVTGTLSAEVLSEGVHSGDAGGVVPGSFSVLRALLERVEEATTGRMQPGLLDVSVPAERVAEAERAARALQGDVAGKYPLLEGVRPLGVEGAELVLQRTWGPSLAVVGQAGLPPLEGAGNVQRPRTALQLSVRLPPTLDADAAARSLKSTLEADPPHGARVCFELEAVCAGWNAPPTEPWLAASLEAASKACFGRGACAMGEGGSIPFMAMLGERFPGAQFLITGVLGPRSNAHGPNEFLHVETGKAVTGCVARVLADHAARSVS